MAGCETAASLEHHAIADATASAHRFGMLEDGPAVWAKLAELSRHYEFAGRQVHDANIVATMIAHGERRLLTLDVGWRRPTLPVMAGPCARA